MSQSRRSLSDITLLEELGRGDGGVVYRAEFKGTSCWVKLPSLPPEGDEAEVAHFTKDALALARVSQGALPRILKINGAAESPYVVMESADARPLSTLLLQTITLPQLLNMSQQLGSMTLQLHALGFSGLDLAPTQVLYDKRLGQPYLLDRGRLSRRRSVSATNHIQAADRIAYVQLIRTCLSRVTEDSTEFQKLLSPLESGQLPLAEFVELVKQLASPKPRRSSYPPPSLEASRVQATYSARDAIVDLRAGLRRAERGQCAVIELVGKPGAGKTHTLESFANELAEEDIMVLTGDCRDSDWLPFASLRRLFSSHMENALALDQDELQAVKRRLVSAAGESLPWLSIVFPDLGELAKSRRTPPREGDAQHLLVESIADFLLNYMRSCAPAVLLLDDVQWIDTSSRKVLARLVGRLDDGGLLLVLGRRDTEKARRVAEQVLRGHAGERMLSVTLDELTNQEAARVTQAFLGTGGALDPEAITRLRALSDGTPLSLTDLLTRALEGGMLTPSWGRWSLDLRNLEASIRNSHVGLGSQRIAALPASSQQVLELMAVEAGDVSPRVLAEALEAPEARIEATLRQCEAQRMVVASGSGRFRLVHDSLRETLLERIEPSRAAKLHHQLALALDRTEVVQGDMACEVARHLAGAGALADPKRLLQVSLLAAEYARDSFDDARALVFFELGERAAERAGQALSFRTLSSMAETYWQNSLVHSSIDAYSRALALSSSKTERIALLGRMAWTYHYAGSGERAHTCLEEAFELLGRSKPHAALTVPKGLLSGLALALRIAPRLPSKTGGGDFVAELETLCRIYVYAYRIYVESGHFRDGVAIILDAARLARALPASRTKVRAYSSAAGVLTLLGANPVSRSLLDEAEATARLLNDPVATTRCLLVRHTTAGWLGDTESARTFAHASAVERGSFMDLGDYCLLCLGMHVLETVLGEPTSALQWLERFVERANLHGQAPPIVALVSEAAQGTLSTLNREHELSRLQRRLAEVESRPLTAEGFPLMLSYQFRIMQLTELGDTGARFEELVDAFEARVTDGYLAHPMVAATFAHILQARIHQGLRVTQAQRPRYARYIERTLRRVKGNQRGDMSRSHCVVSEAACAFFTGDQDLAMKKLAEAEDLARHGPCVWVLYTGQRLRAHILRDRGWHDSALDEARTAALIARRHGHHNRYRWVVDDFGSEAVEDGSVLGQGLQTRLARADDPSLRRHLNALLTISRTGSADLSLQKQASIILEEVMQSLDAERGRMLLRGERGLELVASHAVFGETDPNYSSWAVEAVYAAGQLLQLDPSSPERILAQGITRPTLVAPLVLRGEAMGVLYLDRETSRGMFSRQEGELLLGLASQVPIALELAKSLRERDALELHLRQAQKMEAIGQLAGGIAHDFNNLLATVQIAGGTLSEILNEHSIGKEEIEDIMDVARRGEALTRQLLTFARREAALPKAVNVNSVVASMMPMLLRLVGRRLQIECRLCEHVPAVMADETQVEQVVLNLVTNARDAVADQGTIIIRTRELHEKQLASEGLPMDMSPCDYVVLDVEDNGVGMSPDVQQRAFEPFFSTKPGHLGTGLGLATVYGIVKQFDGHVLIRSAEGRGSTFSIYWPALAERVTATQQRVETSAPSGGGETVLVVDDDAVFCRAAQRALASAGYEVLTAGSRREALEAFDEMGGAIDLVVGDLQMPEDSGLALVRELQLQYPQVRALLISGEPPAIAGQLEGDRLSFLLKPFSPQALATRVRSLLDSRPHAGLE